MEQLLVRLVMALMGLISIFGWFAMMFASLPGAEMSYALSMRIIRGLFYIYPITSGLSIYLLHRHFDTSYFALLWFLGPILPLMIVWFIFSQQ